MKLVVFLLLCLVLCSSLGYSQEVKLRKKFYRDTCRDAEDIVKKTTENHVDKNPSLSAKLLRMYFHDCFVRGCDASVLVSSTKGNTAERDAIPNLSLSGFDVIEDIKAKLEKKCPNTVSCADILTLATRDAVSHQYKFKEPLWEVLTGRRDGRVSIAAEVLQNIPSPFDNFAKLKKNFANKGLTVHDLVVLSGGHTIGVGHCNLFSGRMYNFTGKGDQDPSLDPTYAKFLRSKCSPTDRVTSLEMDPGSGKKFDSNYFSALKQQKGMFVSDAALLTDKIASKTVDELVDPVDFFTEFAQSMERMARIEVLTGVSGEIRTRCSVVNSK